MMKPMRPIEIARYYLKSELGHILPKLMKGKTSMSDIDDLPDADVWSLCEALASYYRLNAVWWALADPNFQWTEEALPIEKIYMTAMGPSKITELIYSEKINHDPIKLRDELLRYYERFPDDPEGYGLRPSHEEISFPNVMVVELKGRLHLVDGSHRFIEQLLAGAQSVQAFVGKSHDGQAILRPMVGESMFHTLHSFSRKADSEQEKEILHEAARLFAQSTDVRQPLARFDDSRKLDKEINHGN